jgi:hypothetical protein
MSSSRPVADQDPVPDRPRAALTDDASGASASIWLVDHRSTSTGATLGRAYDILA